MTDAEGLIDMEALSKLIASCALLLWPIVFAVLLYKLFGPIRALVESARGRKFSIKVAGNELSMEEASEQQRLVLSDLQSKLAELEKRLGEQPRALKAPVPVLPLRSSRRILWVDDKPRHNSYLISTLKDRGVTVDTVQSTTEALEHLRLGGYDIVISDMARPEGDRAGIALIHAVRGLGLSVPVYLYCSAWAEQHLRSEAMEAGAAGITASGTTLLSLLPLGEEPLKA